MFRAARRAPVAGLPRRVEGDRLTRCQTASRRADPVQVETLHPSAGAPGAALAIDPHTVGADPTGLAWSVICCTVWHGSITWAHRYTLIYLIIIGRLRWTAQRPACRWYLVLARVQCLTVCPPTCHRRCTGSLCICCIVCAGIGQINRNAPVKPCKRFLCFVCNCA